MEVCSLLEEKAPKTGAFSSTKPDAPVLEKLNLLRTEVVQAS